MPDTVPLRSQSPLLTPSTRPLFSVAPMMEWTDRHCRALHRLLAPHALLYTEMVTTGALIHGPRSRLLRHDPTEQPVAMQLGGCDPGELAHCAAMAADAGYNEINLNVGCPSDRVQRGRIGACLMREPALVARAVERMCAAVSIPVTVKCRLGVDDDDGYDFLRDFVDTVAGGGADAFIVHARKAILKGLSPAQNRSIPPLRHDVVQQLKSDYPQLHITVNGGLDSIADVLAQLDHVDAVMIGRAAYQNPWLLTALEQALYGTPAPNSRHAVLKAYLPYIERELEDGARLHDMTRHMLGLFNRLPGARRYRQILSAEAIRPGAGIDVLHEAAAAVRELGSVRRYPSAPPPERKVTKCTND